MHEQLQELGINNFARAVNDREQAVFILGNALREYKAKGAVPNQQADFFFLCQPKLTMRVSRQ